MSKWLGPLAVVVLTACGEPAEPVPYAEYVLRSIAGERLPAVTTFSLSVDTWILTDTLRLAEDGTGWRRTVILFVTSGGVPSERLHVEERELTHALVEGRLEIVFRCQDTGSCIAGPHLAGVFTPAGLSFDVAMGRVPLLFERLGPVNVP
jgi:hypothetical protein